MFIDISSFKHESMGGKRHWLIVVDEFSDCSHSFFLKRKSDQIELFPNWIKELKAKYGIDIKYVRLDNSGENKGLQDECEKQNLGIIFEFTAPGTPQQNSVVERKIPTLMGRSRAMMLTAGFSQQDKRKFWCEVISTATKLDNIMVRKERTKPPFTLFYNDEAKYTKFLRSFGELAVIAISDGKKMRSKLDTRGRTGIFVGYADIHAGNVYRLINIQTKKIILSRDIQWLNSFWKEYKKRKDDSKKLVDVFYSHDEDDQTQEGSEADEPDENEEEETNNSGDGNNTEEQKRLGIDIQMIGARKEELGKTRSQTKEMMSPRNESMERAELTMEDWIHETCLISAVTSGPTEPKTFQEAWHSPVEEERHNWQVAIRKEIKSMINRGVWMIQFPPEMDENWVRYGLAKLGQISKLPNWQRMLFCAYTIQLLHSTGEVCWNNNDSYFIWFEFVCRNSGQIASRRSWKRSCLGLEYTSKCSRLALLWEPN